MLRGLRSRPQCELSGFCFNNGSISGEDLGSTIEKSITRIAVWHHEACRVMTNGDPGGQIFISYPHTNNGFFFLLTTVLFIYFYLFISK